MADESDGLEGTRTLSQYVLDAMCISELYTWNVSSLPQNNKI